jgi:hypothetical protein
MYKKREKKPKHTHTVGTAPQTKRKIVERCKIPLTLILLISWEKQENPEK